MSYPRASTRWHIPAPQIKAMVKDSGKTMRAIAGQIGVNYSYLRQVACGIRGLAFDKTALFYAATLGKKAAAVWVESIAETLVQEIEVMPEVQPRVTPAASLLSALDTFGDW